MFAFFFHIYFERPWENMRQVLKAKYASSPVMIKKKL